MGIMLHHCRKSSCRLLHAAIHILPFLVCAGGERHSESPRRCMGYHIHMQLEP